YAGYMEVMSGFNTMDSKERSKYDRYRVTKFMGISFVIAGLGFALGSIFISAMGMSDGTIVGFLVLLAIIFPACIYLTCSKRFLKQ
ncbi:MAG: DUF3784 domain-containing protein, partial [Candidatus Methanoplasma sp.]|nr:DUF3784 domain-containing protein [Candidatus Methanoplasma sp.]